MIISSKANPIIKKISSLSDKKYRREYGEFIVESVKAVDECLSSGMSVSQIVCTAELAEKYSGAIIVTDELFARISTEKAPQGVLAVVKTPEKVLSKPRGNCLLLDRVQDPGNLGTIIRTANAAGYGDIYLVDCTDAFSPKAIRASMGGVFYVNVYEGSYDEVFEALKGVPVICADMDGDDVFSFFAPAMFCLCIGNEGKGVSDTVSAKSDYTVKIPMRDTCESLNAAVSAAIAMYALKNNQKGV
ncbi:MAG: RNA methyltransferase [Clostridia bacterium]|nr:RNA methyltransferase [Clostridia bacterium]